MFSKSLVARQAAIGLALVFGLVLVCQSVEAQKTKGKTRAAETKYLMRGVVQTHCGAINKMLADKGPADDKAWDTLACHASILNEMSHTIMDDGRCPDKDWAGASKSMRDSTAKVLAAAKDKNLDDAKTAFKGVTGSCSSCHKVHKK